MFKETQKLMTVLKSHNKWDRMTVKLNSQFNIDWESASFKIITPLQAKDKKYKESLMLWVCDTKKENQRATQHNWSWINQYTLIGLTRGKTLLRDKRRYGDPQLYGYSSEPYHNIKNFKAYTEVADLVYVFECNQTEEMEIKRESRKESKKGTIAFLSNSIIKKNNKQRYELALQKKYENSTPSNIITDCMIEYNRIYKNHIDLVKMNAKLERPKNGMFNDSIPEYASRIMTAVWNLYSDLQRESNDNINKHFEKEENDYINKILRRIKKTMVDRLKELKRL